MSYGTVARGTEDSDNWLKSYPPGTSEGEDIVATKARAFAHLDAMDLTPQAHRAGFVTTAAAKGVTLHDIMRQTRHKSERVAMTYIRPASVFRNNATDGLGDEEADHVER
jgi:hypothetical protein